MEEHYQDKWSVETLASLINMSVDHFYKFFKSFTRMSPIEYTNDLRIQKAKILLVKDRSKTVTEIAMQTGFCDASYFSKQFKKFAGCTPLEYKREAIGINFVWDDHHGLSNL
jgi:transcriptional regulator GlxA family with amidase domain